MQILSRNFLCSNLRLRHIKLSVFRSDLLLALAPIKVFDCFASPGWSQLLHFKNRRLLLPNLHLSSKKVGDTHLQIFLDNLLFLADELVDLDKVLPNALKRHLFAGSLKH